MAAQKPSEEAGRGREYECTLWGNGHLRPVARPLTYVDTWALGENSLRLLISRDLQCLNKHTRAVPSSSCESVLYQEGEGVQSSAHFAKTWLTVVVFFFSFDLLLKSSWLQLKLAGPGHFTFVSNKAFSRFFSLSWAEALAVALPSWDLILCSSSSSFSRSFSKVWAQLSHSARQIKLT